jgi:hypothetical protein
MADSCAISRFYDEYKSILKIEALTVQTLWVIFNLLHPFGRLESLPTVLIQEKGSL